MYFNGVQVKELVRLSLNQPVKLFVDSNTDTAYNLQQEFVRIRTKHETDREAIVAGIGSIKFCVISSLLRSFMCSNLPWSLLAVSEHQERLPSNVYHSWTAGSQGCRAPWQPDYVTGKSNGDICTVLV